MMPWQNISFDIDVNEWERVFQKHRDIEADDGPDYNLELKD